jgi:hypothetical protein
MLDLFQQRWEDLWQGAVSPEQEMGAIYTKPEIVSFILDLAGYRPSDMRLAEQKLLEPSCGDGAFLSAAVARLIASEQSQPCGSNWSDRVMDSAFRAIELDERVLLTARARVKQQLADAGCPEWRAAELVTCWFVRGDFLLEDWAGQFDYVVGNPPYVRIEALPRAVLESYRRSHSTLSDRADLYVAFIQKGLEALRTDGTLAYICANRFAKNQYGRGLRRLIADHYHVRYYLNLEHTQPFENEVSAYPAIIVLDRRRSAPTFAGTLATLHSPVLQTIAAAPEASTDGLIHRFDNWYPDGGPWTGTSPVIVRSLRMLSDRLPTLEASGPGTRVGIGVATGADKIFILPGRSAEIEADRQVPLVFAGDVSNDHVSWSGRYLLNPFSDDAQSGLVDLGEYPRLAAYLHRHAATLNKRHVARSRPESWYRTIDRVSRSLQSREKLLLPDIQSSVTVGHDEGRFYPHHNLYWIVSDTWNLRALKALIRSSRIVEQVRAYSVEMRGGAVRFQAQTLRRVRVPAFASLSTTLVEELAAAADTVDQHHIDSLADQAFRP